MTITALLLLLTGRLFSAPFYENVAVPSGAMKLEIPLNPYFQTDHLAVPVAIGPGLHIGRFEVSNRQWNDCHAAGACAKKADMREGEGLDHPVVRVTWHDAAAFAAWLSQATGQHWRLPTEHEWFYAAAMGRNYRVEEKQYDYSDLESVRKIPKRTHKRGRFGENSWGVADMAGNVWEWTLSCHTLSESRLLKAPDPAALMKTGACSTRITGGEHRAQVPDFISDTYSGGCSSLKPAANLGFRLVREE